MTFSLSARLPPPNDLPYFTVTDHVAKAMADFDLNHTLTPSVCPSHLSRRLGVRRRECVLCTSRTMDTKYLARLPISLTSSSSLLMDSVSTLTSSVGACSTYSRYYERLRDGWE
jgi:hypothetical protein